VLSFALLLLVVILSYVFSTLSVFLREFLEGKHFGEFLSNALSQHYRDRLTAVERKLIEDKHNMQAIRVNDAAWRKSMGDAYRLVGRALTVCKYHRRPELDRLFDRRLANQHISPLEIQVEVDAMTVALKNNNPELPTEESENLDIDHGALLRLIRYAADKWEAQVVKDLNQVQFEFAGKNVGPTKMGNISEIASYYAASRYSMNLEVFWTRLQKVLQGDVNFYSVLQDAKLQLDFLVGLFWLTLTFTMIWVILLPYFGEANSLFLLIAIFGPVLTWIWYLIALQNNRAFSDLLCAAIDLYRLDLLKMLHVPLPVNAEQERILWKTLEQRAQFGYNENLSLQSS
jgi:hypothetical protein